MNRFHLILISLLIVMLVLIPLSTSIPKNVMFWGIEGLNILMLAALLYFYQRVMRPMQIISNGIELLREQDFSSRLRKVGEPEADRIVDIFNRMMEQMKESRLQLQEQNYLLGLLIEVSPMGIIMLDFDERITSLNPAARQILDYNKPAIGKKIHELDSPLGKRMALLKTGNTDTYNMSNAHIYRCTKSSFIDRGFKHPFFLIESLTEEVMTAERKAYEKVIRMLSHEVNNNTAAINSILGIASYELKEMKYTEEVQKIIIECMRRCDNLSMFITRFADVVKIPDCELRPTTLNDIISANQHFLESLCSSHNIQLIINYCPENPIVMADTVQIAQVLVNIIKNSIESINQKNLNRDIPSSTTACRGFIKICTFATPARLEIIDNGIGISQETECKLFSPFFTTKPTGNGIGLLLSREILLKHQCKFSLSTHSDDLTRFSITFDT